MGSGISVDKESHAQVTSLLTDKPANGSDIKDLTQAKAEIVALRKLALDFETSLK